MRPGLIIAVGLLIGMQSAEAKGDCPHCAKAAQVSLVDARGGSRSGYMLVPDGMLKPGSELKKGDDLYQALDWGGKWGFKSSPFTEKLYHIEAAGDLVAAEEIETVNNRTAKSIIFEAWQGLEATAWPQLPREEIKRLQTEKIYGKRTAEGSTSDISYFNQDPDLDDEDFGLLVRYRGDPDLESGKGFYAFYAELAFPENFEQEHGRPRSLADLSGIMASARELSRAHRAELGRAHSDPVAARVLQNIDDGYGRQLELYDGLEELFATGTTKKLAQFLGMVLPLKAGQEALAQIPAGPVDEGERLAVARRIVRPLFAALRFPMGAYEMEGILRDLRIIQVVYGFD